MELLTSIYIKRNFFYLPLEISTFIHIIIYGEGSKMKLLQNKKGMSLFEIITVVTIIGIILASSFFILGRVATHLKITAAAAQLKQDCSMARQTALEKNKIISIQFHSTSPRNRGWFILGVDSLGFLTDTVGSYQIEPAVWFGGQDDIGAVNGPDGNPIPDDGIPFPANTMAFLPRQGLNSTGVIYFTDGKETQAVMMNQIGNATVMSYVENGNWQ